MIESYLCARDRFLKPGGKMFPNAGTICFELRSKERKKSLFLGVAPFSDSLLHWEQSNKQLGILKSRWRGLQEWFLEE